jgi:hypothetical protein
VATDLIPSKCLNLSLIIFAESKGEPLVVASNYSYTTGIHTQRPQELQNETYPRGPASVDQGLTVPCTEKDNRRENNGNRTYKTIRMRYEHLAKRKRSRSLQQKITYFQYPHLSMFHSPAEEKDSSFLVTTNSRLSASFSIVSFR